MTALGVLVVVGCAPRRDAAPEDLDGQLHWVFRHFEDPDLLADGVDAMSAWLDDTGRTDDAQAGLLVRALRPRDLTGLDRPDRPFEAAAGVAAGWWSPWALADHGEIIVLADQTYIDPPAYDRFDRTITEGDPTAFASGDGTIRTLNDVEKGKIGVVIPYVLRKDFAWVHLDGGRSAVVARSWAEDSACNDGGGSCLWQTYAVDLWYASDALDGTVRVMSTWNELTTSADPFLSDDQKVAVAVNAILDMFEGTDAFLDER